MLETPKTPGAHYTKPERILRIRALHAGIVQLQLEKQAFAYRCIVQLLPTPAKKQVQAQEAIQEHFQALLHTLSFPLQLLIRHASHTSHTHQNEHLSGSLSPSSSFTKAAVRQKNAQETQETPLVYYLIIPASYTGKKSERAREEIQARLAELAPLFANMGLQLHSLTDDDVLTLYRSCIYAQEDAPQTLQVGEEPNRQPDMSGKTSLMPFTRQRGQARARRPVGQLPLTGAEVFPSYMRLHTQEGHQYVRTLSCTSYPQQHDFGWLGTILQLVQAPYVDVSIHIRPLEASGVGRKLRKRASDMYNATLLAQRQGKIANPQQTTTRHNLEHLSSLLEHQVEQVFGVSLLVLVRASELRELNQRHRHVLEHLHKFDIRALPTHWKQFAGWLSCLPEAANEIEQERLLSEWAATCLYPFQESKQRVRDASPPTGVLFGQEANGTPLIIDPFQQKQGPNLVAFGTSESGKSFFTKTVANRLLPRTTLFALDTSNNASYEAFCSQAGGTFVSLTAHSLHINPLELVVRPLSETVEKYDTIQQARFFREKLLHLVTFCELLLSKRHSGYGKSLSRQEKAFLYRCLIKTYEHYGVNANPRTHTRPTPSLHDLHMVLTSAARDDGRFDVGHDDFGLSERLEPYLHYFPRHNDIALTSPCTVLHTGRLPESLQAVGTWLATEFLWTAASQLCIEQKTEIPPAPTLFVLDTADICMRTSHTAQALVELLKPCEDAHIALWCMVRNAASFLNQEAGQEVLQHAAMKLLLRQERDALEVLTETLHFKEKHKNILLRATPGKGLFWTRRWKRIEVVASPEETRIANQHCHLESIRDATSSHIRDERAPKEKLLRHRQV